MLDTGDPVALMDEGIEDAYGLPVRLVLFDERVMTLSLLIEVVVSFALEDNVEADVSVAYVDLAGVGFDAFARGKRRYARMVLEILVTGVHELSPRRRRAIIQGDIDVVGQTRFSGDATTERPGTTCSRDRDAQHSNDEKVSHDGVSKVSPHHGAQTFGVKAECGGAVSVEESHFSGDRRNADAVQCWGVAFGPARTIVRSRSRGKGGSVSDASASV
jgi:hypothetical protein